MPKRVVVFDDVARCVDPQNFTIGSNTACLKVEAALQNFSQEKVQVRKNLYAMNYSNFCVKFASQSIANEFKRLKSG